MDSGELDAMARLYQASSSHPWPKLSLDFKCAPNGRYVCVCVCVYISVSLCVRVY